MDVYNQKVTLKFAQPLVSRTVVENGQQVCSGDEEEEEEDEEEEDEEEEAEEEEEFSLPTWGWISSPSAVMSSTSLWPAGRTRTGWKSALFRELPAARSISSS